MKSLEELKKIREEAKKRVELRTDRETTRIVVGMATCGISAGARPVLTALLEEVNKRNLSDIIVTQTGCIGVCRLEPIVEVYRPGEEKVTYVNMTAEKAKRIVAEHIVNGKIVVEDTGIGIAKDELPLIFDRFFRSDAARKRDGTGLGLSIAEAIVKEHGGMIQVQSELGKGTTFCTQFPSIKQ